MVSPVLTEHPQAAETMCTSQPSEPGAEFSVARPLHFSRGTENPHIQIANPDFNMVTDF